MGSIEDLYGCLAGYGIETPKTDRELNELMASHAADLDETTKSGAKKPPEGEAA